MIQASFPIVPCGEARISSGAFRQKICRSKMAASEEQELSQTQTEKLLQFQVTNNYGRYGAR